MGPPFVPPDGYLGQSGRCRKTGAILIWSPASSQPGGRAPEGGIFGASEESNGVPTSFRYVRDRLLEAAWGLPSSVSLDESAEVCFTVCS